MGSLVVVSSEILRASGGHATEARGTAMRVTSKYENSPLASAETKPGGGADTVPKIGQSRHGLVLAFDLGRLLNQFGWHVPQTVIGDSLDHRSQAGIVLEQIEVVLVEFAPAQRGGSACHQVAQLREEWDGSRTCQSADRFYEAYAAAYNPEEANPYEPASPAANVISALDHIVIGYQRELRAILENVPTFTAWMRIAFHLGECIDQGIHPPDIMPHLIVEELNQRWLDWRKHFVRLKRRLGSPAEALRRCGSSPRKRHVVPRCRADGEIPPSRIWHKEVEALWHALIITTPLPVDIATVSEADEETRRRIVRQVTECALASLTNLPDPQSEHCENGFSASDRDLIPPEANNLTTIGTAQDVQLSLSTDGSMQKQESDESLRPKWDKRRRELRLVSKSAKCIITILDAFEARGFPTEIDDPLMGHVDRQDSPGPEYLEDPPRLHDAIKSLNKGLEPNTIRFHANGTGRGIYWKHVQGL
jgi:hypothetical protein